MAYDSVVISAGHSKHVRGAAGPTPWGLDEVDEARLVMDRVASELRSRGVTVKTYADDVSTTQNENLNRIVDYHNSQYRDLDISVHFNAYQVYTIKAKPKGMGTEVLYLTQGPLAAELSSAIASNGFLNRGAKVRSDLFFLNHTAMPAVLIETCFVDSEADCAIYRDKFDHVCASIANIIGGEHYDTVPPSAEGPPPPLLEEALFQTTGKCSWFGGPNDTTGVSASEGLAFHYSLTPENQHLFLPIQPANSTGLARRLNSKAVGYVACRWDYAVTPKTMLASSDNLALVRATKTGREALAYPADWGPHEEKTGRVADLSEFLMMSLGVETDDEVTVIYPYRGE